MEGRVSHFLDNLQKDGSYTHCMCPCAHCMCLYAIWEQRFRTDAQGTMTHKLMRLPVSASVSILRPSFQKQRHLSVLRLAFHCGFQWPVLSSSGFTVQTVSPLCPNPRLDNLQKRNNPRYSRWSFCCLASVQHCDSQANRASSDSHTCIPWDEGKVAMKDSQVSY